MDEYTEEFIQFLDEVIFNIDFLKDKKSLKEEKKILKKMSKDIKNDKLKKYLKGCDDIELDD